jgi:hypothetical protein
MSSAPTCVHYNVCTLHTTQLHHLQQAPRKINLLAGQNLSWRSSAQPSIPMKACYSAAAPTPTQGVMSAFGFSFFGRHKLSKCLKVRSLRQVTGFSRMPLGRSLKVTVRSTPADAVDLLALFVATWKRISPHIPHHTHAVIAHTVAPTPSVASTPIHLHNDHSPPTSAVASLPSRRTLS